jgi:hypothetical protein
MFNQTMNPTTTTEATQLHNSLPCISIETIEELSRRELLHFGDDYWRLGDESNGTRRRLNGRKW